MQTDESLSSVQECGFGSAQGSFEPPNFVYISGIMLIVSTLTLGIFCVLTVLQIIAISFAFIAFLLLADVAGELSTLVLQ